MNTLKILGITTISLMISCTPKDKNPEIDVNPKTDPMAIQTPMDTTKNDSAGTAHNSENSLDWYGTYEAVVPCADCPGIKTVLILNKDKTFKISEEYLERKTKNEDKGTFEWNDVGSVITLKGKNSNYKYKVGENTVTQLDMNGHPIDGPNKNLYVFKKK
ncbi:putative lipoprotein NlpE involved in copper resistance [Chryseobacterium ginsenosidimutans]|uniref:copper resistance protein NlpE n=1 Tax=Chryseobacterium ginsenosidimutans TaxID=687846 RepID=UPI002784778D|nr:copper resistance protein NlpE [Chryseobacterium ginsenosidimutans]MDQ0595279.1 putative lipoprotein NlpE involved in copper resistance [Chryseobacterium ginsenosidimutans]